MKTNYIILSAIIGSMLVITSCMSYSDKSIVTAKPATGRLVNTWKINNATEKGVNITDNYEVYELSLNRVGSADLKFKNKVSEFITHGTWKFIDHNQKIAFKFEKVVANGVYTITKLKRNLMCLKKEGSSLELEFITKPQHEENIKSFSGY